MSTSDGSPIRCKFRFRRGWRPGPPIRGPRSLRFAAPWRRSSRVEPRPGWEAFSLKLSYLDLTRDMAAPVDYVHRAIADGKTYRLAGLEIPIEFSAYLYPVHRFLKREPERSRRSPPADLRQLAGPSRGPRAAGE